MARFIAFLCCLVGLHKAVAQSSLGLKVSPGLTFLSNGYDPSPSFSGGVYWDRQLYRALGFSTGLQFTHLTASQVWTTRYQSRQVAVGGQMDRFEILELPMDLSWKLGNRKQSKAEVFVVAGYSLGMLLGSWSTAFGHCDWVGEDEPHPIPGIDNHRRDLHFGKLGLEVRHRIGGWLSTAMGLQFKYVSLYNERYGSFNGVNLYLKVGI